MSAYVTATQAAEQLTCSVKTIKRMCEDGRLRGARVMNRWQIEESSLDDYLQTLTLTQLEVINARRHEREQTAGRLLKN